MKKVWLFLAIAISAFSCVTESRAKKYLDKHPSAAKEIARQVFDNDSSLSAGYCIQKFPVQESVDTVKQAVDSSLYYSAIADAIAQTDSMWQVIIAENMVDKDTVNALLSKAKVDTAAIKSKWFSNLKKASDRALAAAMKPLLDSIKIIRSTKVSTAELSKCEGRYLVLKLAHTTLQADSDRWEKLAKDRAKYLWEVGGTLLALIVISVLLFLARMKII